MEKILIIVPAYNEGENIVDVINGIKNFHPNYDILLIDDGSKDETSKRAKSTSWAKVIELPINLGIGGAVQTGFKYAKQNGYEIAVQFDGDGQHLASEIAKIIEPLRNGEADIVIGSRFCEKSKGFKSTFTRRLGIRLFALVNSLLIHNRITDNTSGFRAYNKEAISFLAENYPADYPEPEAVVLLGRNGFRIKEVATQMLERRSGSSSISAIISIYYMLKVMLAIFMNFIRPKIIKGKP